MRKPRKPGSAPEPPPPPGGRALQRKQMFEISRGLPVSGEGSAPLKSNAIPPPSPKSGKRSAAKSPPARKPRKG